MRRWAWRHAEYRVHDGWVPQVDVRVVDDGHVEDVTLHLQGAVVALDTKQAARAENRRLAESHAAQRGWDYVAAENE